MKIQSGCVPSRESSTSEMFRMPGLFGSYESDPVPGLNKGQKRDGGNKSIGDDQNTKTRA